MTHASDFAVGFVGLLGHPGALGEAFHITSDEVLTWDAIYETIARAAGAEARLVHVPSALIAALVPDKGGSLLGDKAQSTYFDNAKVRRLVPEFQPRVSFAEGIARSIAWFDADPSATGREPGREREHRARPHRLGARVGGPAGGRPAVKPEDVERIHEASLRILDEVGVRLEHDGIVGAPRRCRRAPRQRPARRAAPARDGAGAPGARPAQGRARRARRDDDRPRARVGDRLLDDARPLPVDGRPSGARSRARTCWRSRGSPTGSTRSRASWAWRWRTCRPSTATSWACG